MLNLKHPKILPLDLDQKRKDHEHKLSDTFHGARLCAYQLNFQ